MLKAMEANRSESTQWVGMDQKFPPDEVGETGLLDKFILLVLFLQNFMNRANTNVMFCVLLVHQLFSHHLKIFDFDPVLVYLEAVGNHEKGDGASESCKAQRGSFDGLTAC